MGGVWIAAAGRDGNHRNGTYPKTVLTEEGALDLDVPRDRNGSFEPQIVPKGETRLDVAVVRRGRLSPLIMASTGVRVCGLPVT